MAKQNLFDIKLPVQTKNIRIRFWESKDFSCVQSAALDPYIPTVTSIPSGCNEAQAKDWINRQLQKIADGTDLPLCISTAANDQAVGMVGVFGLEGNAATARCGYWIAPEKRGKNHSGKALKVVSEWAFNTLNLEKLELFIEPDNSGSLKTAEFAGYSFDRTQPSETEIAGSFRQMSVFIKMRSSK